MRSPAWLCVLVPLAAAGQAPDFSRLVREQAPAVVSIAATYATPPVIPDVPHDEPVLGLFEWVAAGPAPGFESPLLGSGFIVSSDGDIVTAHHVVEHALNNQVVVRLADGRELIGRVAGSDRASDIALVRVRAASLPTVRIGDPARVQPGHWAVTIGAPFGFEQTVAAGVVSTAARAMPAESRFRFIQTDSAINPGHSGGPLFNLTGEVVGVNSRMFGPGGGSIGLSFAVPIDLAMQVIEQLRASGVVRRGHLGLSVQQVSAELAQAFRLERSAGALVTSVEPRGPADQAGLRAGDVITRLAGTPVESPTQLMALVDEVPPGTGFALELVREGRPERAAVRSALPDDGRDRRIDIGDTDRFGLSLMPLGEPQRRRLAVPGGAVVQRAEGAARLAGVHAGDILLAVNGIPVRNPPELLARLAVARSGDTVALLVDRMGSRAFLALRVP
jgi:serine protease Do